MAWLVVCQLVRLTTTIISTLDWKRLCGALLSFNSLKDVFLWL